jgi:hypothetical protein
MHTNLYGEIEGTYTKADWVLDTAIIVTIALSLAVLAFEYFGGADAIISWVGIVK